MKIQTWYDRWKWAVWVAVIFIISFLLTSCSTGRCYPSKKSKDYATVTVKHIKTGWLVTHRTPGKVTQYLYECLPDSLTKW